MKHTQEAHVISANNDCKELLLIIGDTPPTHQIPIHCINLTSKEKQSFVFTREEEARAECTYTEKVGTYLYEPNASILKAGAFRSIAASYHTRKLHPNSHLYTSDEWIKEFPGRVFQVNSNVSHLSLSGKHFVKDTKYRSLTFVTHQQGMPSFVSSGFTPALGIVVSFPSRTAI